MPREMFVGRWRITSVKGWETADIDLLGPAYIEFARRGNGESLEDDGLVIEWSWVGDDGSETSGRGWAQRDGDKMTGQIFVHGADEFRFEALLLKPRRSSRGG